MLNVKRVMDGREDERLNQERSECKSDVAIGQNVAARFDVVVANDLYFTGAKIMQG